jgi:hypothetical protein
VKKKGAGLTIFRILQFKKNGKQNPWRFSNTSSHIYNSFQKEAFEVKVL